MCVCVCVCVCVSVCVQESEPVGEVGCQYYLSEWKSDMDREEKLCLMSSVGVCGGGGGCSSEISCLMKTSVYRRNCHSC